MRFAFGLIVLGLAAGCSVSAGAGARFGGESNFPTPECDSFEACDLAYQEAVETAQRCHEEDGDCEDADRNVRVTYGALREQTAQELGALRGEVEERNAAEDEPEADEQELDRGESDAPRHAPETPPPARRGNTWFDSEYGPED